LFDVFVFLGLKLLLLTLAQNEGIPVLQSIDQTLVNVRGESYPVGVTRLVKLSVEIGGEMLVKVKVAHTLLVGNFLGDV
jgi:hypothetical protein